MALKGSLSDMGIVDLIQFPNRGRKTGELLVSAGAATAHLFYDAGELVHVQADGRVGLDALVGLVDLEAGEFEFNPSGKAAERTIEQDLHRTLMQALKVRDERRLEEQRRRAEEEERRRNAAASGIDARLEPVLRDFLQSQSFVEHAAMLGFNGEPLAEVSRTGRSNDGIELLRMAVHTLCTEYPRTGLQRIFIEDDAGLTVGVMFENRRMLLVVASKGPAMGAVAMSVSKLAASLTQGSGR